MAGRNWIEHIERLVKENEKADPKFYADPERATRDAMIAQAQWLTADEVRSVEPRPLPAFEDMMKVEPADINDLEEPRDHKVSIYGEWGYCVTCRKAGPAHVHIVY